MQVYIVSHTHWDREWCKTFEEYRVKLVKMMDKLISILEGNPKFKFFTLDGQTIILEDYLQIRPEKEEKIKKFIEEGKILIGPFYVLPDEFLVSGEALIRNLLIGDKISKKFGKKMKVGYIPDPFGHISQLPQILKGFNIDNAVLWRGISKNESSEYLWKSPDGSEVLLIHLQSPLFSGYSNGWYLSYDFEKELLETHLNFLKNIATTQNILLMNGRDHAEPSEKLIENIEYLNKEYKDYNFIHSNLEKYVEEVRKENPKLPILEGELRNPSYKTDYLLPGVLSSRNYLKIANFEICHEVERILEPLFVVSYLNLNKYDSSFLEYLWKLILQNHAHDSICGCSIDEVHEEMEKRFLAIKKLISELEENISLDLFKAGENIILFNPSCWNRKEVVKIPIMLKDDAGKGVKIYDEEGKELEYQLLYIKDFNRFVMDERNIRNMEKGKEYLISLEVDLPALSFRKIKVERCKDRYLFISSEKISKSFGVLENEYLKVSIQNNGSIVIEDKENKKVYKNLHVFEDGGDIGDEYNYCPPRKDRIYTTLGNNAKISLIYNGKFLAEYLVEIDFEVPKDSEEEERDKELIKIPIKSYISLRKGEKFVRVRTEIENRAKNHRLRVLFESGAKNSQKSFAYTPFDIVERKIEPIDPKGRIEYPYNYHPFQNFVGVFDEERGLAISAKGLYEYEIKDDEEKTIALTLIRAIGWLSRELPSRYTIAGPIIETPSAQCLRNITIEYAIIPFRSYEELLKNSLNFIDNVKVFYGENIPQINSLFEVDRPIFLSSIKKSERDEGIIVRFCNLNNREEEINMKLKFDVKKVEEVSLLEEKIKDVSLNNDKELKLKIPKKKILSLKIFPNL